MNTKHRLGQLTVFFFAMILCVLFQADVHGAVAILVDIAISGPESVATASTASYTCNAIWNDGTVSPIRPTWSLSSNYASVDMAGLVTNTNSTTSNKTVTLKAAYAMDGAVKEVSKTITIAQKKLMSIAIKGDESIAAGGTATYKCSATWSYGPSSMILSPIWMVTPSTYATVSTSGVVTNNNTEATNQTVRLTVTYLNDGVTLKDAISITLEAAEVATVQRLSLTAGWNWIGFHVLPSSRKVGDTLGTVGFTANDLIQTSGGMSRFNGTGWLPSSFTLDYGKMYQFYSAKDMVLNVEGSESDSSDTMVNSGWSWITNPTDVSVEPADLVHSGGWMVGDRIQSNTGTVTFTGRRWLPSNGFLLEPGKGYQIYTANEGMLKYPYVDADDELYVVVDLSGGPNAASYPVRYSMRGPDLSDDKCRTTELWLRKIPAGTFIMGSPEDEEGRAYNSDEIQHEVTLTQDFYMGVFECTQKQWELVMGSNPSYLTGDCRPVERVAYDMIHGKPSSTSKAWPTEGHAVDPASFMGQLQMKTGLTFDLPTEAQWEYACRAGTTTALNSGKNLTSSLEDPAMSEIGRYGANQSDGKGGYSDHTTVGSYPPNNWGLYDMHGNVEEWCLDWYGDYGTDAVEDPQGPNTGNNRVIRDGGYNSHAYNCRAAHRASGNVMHTFSPSLGFRVAFHSQKDLYAVVDLSGGPNAETYPVRYSATGPDVSDNKCRTTELWLRKISAGTFEMGTWSGEVGHNDSDMARRLVTLTQDYYIGVFECTQKQWELVMGRNPSMYTGDTRPVEQISYTSIRGDSATGEVRWPEYGHAVDATSFMGKLQAKTGLTFDLPTEAQWEYACRVGTLSALNSGKNLTSTDVDANMAEVGRYYGNMYDGIGGYGPTTKVGCYQPNTLGLYDMHGNVEEWCLDRWGADTSSTAEESDPVGPRTGELYRVIRGGSWNNPAKDCRSAYRNSRLTTDFVNVIGFRVACHQKQETQQDLYAVVDLSDGPNAESYPVRYSTIGPDLSDDTCRTTELWLRKISAGTFIMGSPEDELGRGSIDMAQHKVTLTQDYYIGVFECTQKQWELVMGSNPSQQKGACRPVEISYDKIRGTSETAGAGWPAYGHTVDSTSFMGVLQQKTGLVFDLPTEAQWEYACRAGTTTALNSGKNLTNAGQDDAMDEVGRYGYNDSDGKGGYSQHTTVGSYLPNAWGLYDMHGNIEEWCLDWGGASIISTADETDPVGPSSGTERVNRGGVWSVIAGGCRSASRSETASSSDYNYWGFRVACYPKQNLYVVVDLSGGIRAKSYPVRYTDVPPNVDDDTCRTTELWLRRIPKGTFMMGSPEDELGHYDSEEQQEVTLRQDFYIGVFECTQKQWELVAGSNPSFGKGDCRPVDSVSYDMIRGTSATGGAGWPENGYVVDMNSFLGILRNKTGLTFDLPMASQWEYACRAGTTTALNSGKNLTSMESDANMDEVGRYSYNLNDGKGGYSEHTKVGSYLPNAWGLYDMHGNVQEWCLDRYGDSYRVLRGGAFCDKARLCRSASDNAAPSSNENYYYGFRLFLLLP